MDKSDRSAAAGDLRDFLHLLEREGLSVAGVASTAAEALHQCQELRPNVALVDIDLGAESGFDLAGQLTWECQGCQVTLISASSATAPADPAGQRQPQPGLGQHRRPRAEPRLARAPRPARQPRLRRPAGPRRPRRRAPRPGPARARPAARPRWAAAPAAPRPAARDSARGPGISPRPPSAGGLSRRPRPRSPPAGGGGRGDAGSQPAAESQSSARGCAP